MTEMKSLLVVIFVFFVGTVLGLAWQDTAIRKALLLPSNKTTVVDLARDCRCTCTNRGE